MPRGPARADRATEYRARNQLFGGEPLFAVSPYLDNGPGTDQNRYCNVHNQHSSATGTAGATSMALSTIGENWDLPRMLCASGARCIDRVTMPSGKKRYRFRVEYNDGNAHGQSGRKVLIRNGDTGAEYSNGLGVLRSIGQRQLYAFTTQVDAQTRALLSGMDDALFWQLKNSTDQPVVSLNFCSATYRNGFSTPPGAGTGPSVMLRLLPGAWSTSQYRVLDNYQAGVPMHWLVLVTTGVSQWVTGKVYGPGEHVHNAGQVYKRQTGGSNGQTSGVTAPTGTGTGISDGTCLWDRVMATPAANVEPRVEVWLALGDAAYAKVADVQGRSNLYPDGNGINVQWGWYVAAVGVDSDWTTPAPAVFWQAGDYLELDYSEMTAARLSIASLTPNAYVLNQLFEQLRARF